MQESDVDYSLIPHYLQLVLEEKQITLTEALRSYCLSQGLRLVYVHDVTKAFAIVSTHDNIRRIYPYTNLSFYLINNNYMHVNILT